MMRNFFDKRRVMFLSLVIFLSFLGQAQGKALTLNEAIKMALSNNKEILIAKEKVKEAEQALRIAKGGYFPNLGLDVTYTHLSEVPSVSFMGTPLEMGKQDSYLSKLTLTQPLYTSGRLSLTWRQAELNCQRVKEDLVSCQNEVIFQVKEAFYSVILAQDVLKVTRQALKQAERHLKVVEELFRTGAVSRFDLLRSQVEVANLKPDLIRAENNLRLAKERLANLLCITLDSTKIEGELSFEPVDISLEEAIDRALRERSELKSLRLQREASEVSLSLARIWNLPSMSLVGNYQYENPFEGRDEWGSEWNINIVLSLSLFDGGIGKARIAQRKSQLAQVELSLQQLEEGIILEVKRNFWEMKALEEVIYAQRKNVEQAQEALSIAESRYANGTATNLEVLDAQLALTRARTNYVKALYDYNVAKAKLERAMK